MAGDMFGSTTDEQISSPLPTGTPQYSTPSITWQQILSAITQLSGGNNSNMSFGTFTQQPGSDVNKGIPLYSMPSVYQPAEDQQKQTSEGDVATYAKIFSNIFGGGAK